MGNFTRLATENQPNIRLFVPEDDGQEHGTQQADGTQIGPGTQTTLGHKQITHANHDFFSRQVVLAIQKARVLSGDKRSRKMFELACRLKGIPGFDPTPANLKRVLRTWNNASVPPATGRWKKQLWKQFNEAWRRVEYPFGQNFRDLVEKSRVKRLPAWAAHYRGKRKLAKLPQLIKLCVVLEKNLEGKPWALSLRMVMEALDVGKGTAERMMQKLREDGVIILVEAGKRGSHSQVASTWRVADAYRE